MVNWVPLHLHSEFSLRDGISKTKKIAEKCKELEYSACALTDHGVISGCVGFFKNIKDKGIKPLLGCEFYICEKDSEIKDTNNRHLSHLPIIAYNHEGWKNLVKLSNESHKPQNYYYSPRLSLDKLKDKTSGLISFSGHAGSDLANCLLTDLKGYSAKTYEEACTFLRGDYEQQLEDYTRKYVDLFGSNFKYEIQLIDIVNLPIMKLIAGILRDAGKKNGIDCIATPDSHYVEKKDAVDQRIVLCSSMKYTMNQTADMIANDVDFGFKGFFESNNYHIPTIEELLACGHTEEELENTLKIADKYQEYKLLSPPQLPNFPCPDGVDQKEYFLHLLREGWKSRKILNTTQYNDRINEEIKILTDVGLEGYFLIVQDYVNWSKKQGAVIGPARGSAAGSLAAYLLGITEVDPLPYNLLFSRFYNAGRNSPGKVSMPDIDVDFPKYFRENVINYIKDKYGHNKVMQIATFGRMQGRAVLKEVFRAYNVCSPEEMNEITRFIPDEAKIADELQEMREAGEEPSILRWALENNDKQLSPWVRLNDDGSLSGDYASYFEQAMRLEGIKQSQGKHAAGIVISPHDLYENYPLLYDKHTGENILGLEMTDVESLGLVKMDVLGVSALDKIQGVRNTLLTGKVG